MGFFESTIKTGDPLQVVLFGQPDNLSITQEASQMQSGQQ
jgi:hypothetical protein